MSLQDITNYYINGTQIDSSRVNDECPICLEKFKVNDELVYGCDAQHLHHSSCFKAMLETNNYTCSLCRHNTNIEYSRKFKPFGCCDKNPTENDRAIRKKLILLPPAWCVVNICCPFYYLRVIYIGCCTKEYLSTDESVVRGILTDETVVNDNTDHEERSVEDGINETVMTG